MNIATCLMLMTQGALLPCLEEGGRELTWEAAWQLLGSPVDELRRHSGFSVDEYPRGVDEDEVTSYSQSWRLICPDGSSFLLRTDDGTVTTVLLPTRERSTPRGVRVGDSLTDVKRAYPESRFFDGSRDTVSTGFRLYADDGNLTFTFRDSDVWDALRRGESFAVNAPRVRDVKLWLISFTDGNRFACDEEFPCSDVPDWIVDD